MIIKPEKAMIQIIFLFWGMIFIFLFFSCINGMYVLGIPVSFIMGIVAVRYWMALGRTLVLDEKGCSVKFLWYEKNYKWEDLIVKQQANYKNVFSYRFPYTEGIIFSPYFIRKPKWLGPVEYSILVHPLSFIFLFFSSERDTNLNFAGIYEVDENTIKENLRKWHVELSK